MIDYLLNSNELFFLTYMEFLLDLVLTLSFILNLINLSSVNLRSSITHSVDLFWPTVLLLFVLS